MNNFTLHKNNSVSNNNYPFLLIVQADLLNELKSRVVIPVIKKSVLKTDIKILNPEFEIDNDKYILLTQQMTTVPVEIIGSNIDFNNLDRSTILSAIDFLITGF